MKTHRTSYGSRVAFATVLLMMGMVSTGTAKTRWSSLRMVPDSDLLPGGEFTIGFDGMMGKSMDITMTDSISMSIDTTDPLAPDSVIVVEEPVPDFVRGMIDSVWTFIHPDGRREQRRIATRMYMPHEIAGLLTRCGFDGVELHGSVEGEPYGLDAPRCIAVARKPG